MRATLIIRIAMSVFDVHACTSRAVRGVIVRLACAPGVHVQVHARGFPGRGRQGHKPVSLSHL
eukprot:1191783-Prorocentrum_minimum.AAC.5